MTVYVTIDEAIRIHHRLFEEFGGSAGVRDLGLLQSALLRPQSGYYGDLVEEAAALWESLGMNHPFVDGNKRVAVACVDIFLAMNGVDIVASDDEAESFVYGNLEAGTFNKSIIETWLRSHTASRPTRSR